MHLYNIGNYLGPEGLIELSPGIASTRTLEILELSACGLGRPIFIRSSKASLHAKEEVLEAWAIFVAAINTNLFSQDVKEVNMCFICIILIVMYI